MMLVRRGFLAGVAGLILLAGCAGAGTAQGPNGEPLADDRGMLFQFPDVAERGFWMHNTPSSLDIIYIDPYGRIVSIAERVTPNSDAIIPSNGPAMGVLEIRAGRADEIGAKAGDRVRHPFFAE